MQFTPLRTERKDHLDIVTESDLASEAIIVTGLKALTPDLASSPKRAARARGTMLCAGSSIRSTARSTTRGGCRGFP
jgi:hypothetical protein